MNTIRLFFLKRFALNSYISQDYQKALFYYNKILAANPKEPGMEYNMGLCFLGLGEFDQAETYLLLDMETGGETLIRLKTMGDLYYRWKKRIQAQSYYSRLADLSGNDDTENWLSLRLKLLANEKNADQAFLASDLMDRALHKIDDKDIPEAVALLQKGAQYDPSSYQIQNNLGVITMKMEHDPEKALFHFTRADRLMPQPVHKANILKIQKHLPQ